MIDVKIINSVLSSITESLNLITGNEIVLQKPALLKSIEERFEVVANIGFNGFFKGNLIYTFKSQTAIEIANKMMNGMNELTEIDEIALSAVGELGNIISGTIATNLERKGYPINITPPSVVSGKTVQVSSNGKILKLSTSIEKEKNFDIFLVVKEK